MTEVQQSGQRGSAGLVTSVFRTFVSPLWKFTLFPISYGTLGTVIGSIEHGWNWELWAIAVACIWFGHEGLHAFDLADEELMIHLDERIEGRGQFVIGVLQLGLGGALGVLLASMTTWWFLAIVGLGLFSGLAYNLEWFDGRLHDRVYPTGPGNLGFCIGWTMTFGGYFLMAQQFHVGAAVFAVGPMLHVASTVWLQLDIKPEFYKFYGIPNTREYDSDFERLQKRAVIIGPVNIVAVMMMATGLMILFVL